MNERVIWVTGHGIILLAVLAAIAFVSGYWGILIALAPAAYLLVFFPYKADNSPKTVVISHFTALISGWILYTVLAQGIAPTNIEPMSEPGLQIVASALFAFVASTAIFYALHIEHPMAYVTAFTAAISAFPSIQSLVVVGGTIVCVAGIQIVRRIFGPEPDAESAAGVSDVSSTANHNR